MRDRLAAEGRSDSIEREQQWMTALFKQRTRLGILRERCLDKQFESDTTKTADAKSIAFGCSLFATIS